MAAVDHVVELLGEAREALKVLREGFTSGDTSEHLQSRGRDCSLAITKIEEAMFWAHGFNRVFTADLPSFGSDVEAIEAN